MAHNTSKPERSVLQQYLAARRKSDLPPPSPEEIRRVLGWNMLQPDWLAKLYHSR